MVAPLGGELLIITRQLLLLLLALVFFVADADDPIADCGWPKYLIMIGLTIILIHAVG